MIVPVFHIPTAGGKKQPAGIVEQYWLVEPLTIHLRGVGMSMDEQPGKDTEAYELAGDLTIYRVAELREGLLQFASRANTVTVDLRGVAECDAAGLQLLVSLKKTAEEAGKEFLMIDAPDTVAGLIRELGLEAVCPVH